MTTARTLTTGKIRGLSQASTPEGIFSILALDHRDSMKAVIAPDDLSSVTADAVTSIKLDLLRAVDGETTAVMLDPEFSIGQAIASRALPGHVGFIAAVETQGYLGDPTVRGTSLLDGWSVAKAKRAGASGIKLLVLYRPDSGSLADEQDELIRAVIEDCAREDIALFLEPLAYAGPSEPPIDSPEFAATRRQIVIDSVRRLAALGPEVMKVQFPVDTRFEHDRGVWANACAELHEACSVPWALLSGGDPFELFREQVQVAATAGASGFMVGRALWGEVVTAPAEDRQRLVETVVQPRFQSLSAIAREHGRDWADRHVLPDIDERWYLTY